MADEEPDGGTPTRAEVVAAQLARVRQEIGWQQEDIAMDREPPGVGLDALLRLKARETVLVAELRELGGEPASVEP